MREDKYQPNRYFTLCTFQNADLLNRAHMQFRLAKVAVKYDA
jgi:hypothetical protein